MTWLFLIRSLTFLYRNDDETNSKHGDDDEDIRSTKDEDRPSSSGLLIEWNNETFIYVFFSFTSGLDDEESTTHPSESDPNLIWPSMQDLNTRLRRVITSYQRNYKKEELKQQQKAKVRIINILNFEFTFIITLRALWESLSWF